LRDRKRWLDAMAARGYTAPTWPRQYGGAGLSPQEAKVLQQELMMLRMPPALMGLGLTMIGATLLVPGSEEQKLEHLPKIVSGEVRWCQGFSEPNAGSDLASLRMSAKLTEDGQHYVLNGQKVWTSGAQWAHAMFLIARTSEESKHGGITFLLADMKTPGISIKPIRLISGNSPFCETFFDNAQVPVKNVVGGEGFGWTVAKTLLNFERSGMGTGTLGPGAARRGPPMAGSKLVDLAKDSVGTQDGKLADEGLRQRLAQLLMDQAALQLTIERSAATAKQKGAPGPEISMFKLYASELGHRRDELLMAMRGTDAIAWSTQDPNEDDAMLARMWLSAKATTIFGGTSEIQRNIIAKRVLKLG
jgi:alkylation response protein AidB-like acyl-CoA dehydrogenase